MRLALFPVALWLLLYAPGHYLLLPSASDERRGGSLLFREVLLSACCSSWLGFILAEFRVYSVVAHLAALALVALGGRFTVGKIHRRYRVIDLVGPGLMVIVSLWAGPPFDTRLRAGDSAGYLAAGAHLCRHGSFIMHDPVLTSLSPDLKRALFPSVSPDRGSPPYLRLQGSLVMRSLDSDEVLPAFHHLIAVWIAAFYEFGGAHLAAWVTVVFAGLSVWAMVEFALVVAGPSVAVVFLILLLLLSPQYWYSRFLMPEVAGQFFLWGGLGCLAFWSRSTRPADVRLAGAAFGIAGLMRLENIGFLAVALLAAACVWRSQERRLLVGLFALAVPIWLHASVHLLVFRTHYVANLESFVREMWVTFSVVAPVLVAAGVVVVIVSWKLMRGVVATLHRRWYFICLIVALGLSLYGDYRHGWPSIALLGYYGGAPLLIGGGLGLLISARTVHDGEPALQLLLLVMAFVLLQVIAEPHATPVPIWMVRRAVTVLLPALCFGVALLCGIMSARWHWILALVLFGMTAVAEVHSLRPMWRRNYYAGATRHVDAVAALIAPDARLFIDGALIGSGIDIALWSQHDWPAYFLAPADRGRILELARAVQGAPIYWISDGSMPPPQGGRLRATPIGLYEFVLATPILEMRAEPGASANWQYAFAIYSLQVVED